MKSLYLNTAAILLNVPAAFASDGVTVIKTENGPVRINTTDYDATKHELHVADDTHDADGVAYLQRGLEPEPTKTVPPIVSPIDPGAPETDTAPGRNMDKFGVLQNKNKFFIVDGSTGKVVDDVEGIDPKGYPDNGAAWAVLLAIKAPKPADNA